MSVVNEYLEELVYKISLSPTEIKRLEKKADGYKHYISDSFEQEVEFIQQGSFDNDTIVRYKGESEIDLDTAIIMDGLVLNEDELKQLRTELFDIVKSKNSSMLVSNKNSCVNVVYKDEANLDFSIKTQVDGLWYIITKNGQFYNVMNPKTIGEQLRNLSENEKKVIQVLKYIKARKVKMKSIQINALILNAQINATSIEWYLRELNELIQTHANLKQLFEFDDYANKFDYSEIDGETINFETLRTTMNKLIENLDNYEDNADEVEKYFGFKMPKSEEQLKLQNTQKMFSDIEL